MWGVSWAHPKFGSIVASCGYDARVVIWKEHQVNNQPKWTKIKEHVGHSASVNAVQFAPHEYGLVLCSASSDGTISLLTYTGLLTNLDGGWETTSVLAHSIGVNACSWCPSTLPGSLVQTPAAVQGELGVRRIATGGCDNLVKIFKCENNTWTEEHALQGHTDWVRDVSFAPSIATTRTTLASCSQDKNVLIWTTVDHKSWQRKPLKKGGFSDVVWRVSWSNGGNILAVSTGDNLVTMWKEGVDGEFVQIADVVE